MFIIYLILLLKPLEGTDNVCGLGRVWVKFIHLVVWREDCVRSAFKLHKVQREE